MYGCVSYVWMCKLWVGVQVMARCVSCVWMCKMWVGV